MSKIYAMKNILFTDDFSDLTQMGLTYAIELSIKFKTRLTLLHIHDISALLANPTEIPYFPNTNGEFLEAQMKKMKEHFTSLTENKSKEIDVQFEAIEHTSVSIAIIEKTEELNTDLLIMGAHGKRQFQEFLIGSVTKSVITDCLCPVLVIPFGAKFHLPEKIVFASDLGNDNIEGLHALVDFCKIFDSKITIMHVATNYESFSMNTMNDFKKQIEVEINYSKVSFEFLLSDDINERLDEYIKENNIHMITMIEHENKGFFSRLFQKDHVKNMISHSEVPILCYNQKYLVKRSFNEVPLQLK